MTLEPLETTNASARFDETSGIVYVTYRGYLNSEASSLVYGWLKKLVDEIGEERIYGEIFDFRNVLEFMPDNLMDARKKARGLNLRMERLFPVAMVVKDFYQEEILRGPMQNVPENTRKRIVRTIEEGLAFLEEWHTSQTEEA